MAGKKVVLCWNAKTPRGWRRFPARFKMSGNRQVLLHGSVVDGGEVVQYDTGRYELRSYSGGKMIYTPLREGDQSSPEAAMLAWHQASRAARGNTRKADPFHFLKSATDLYIRDLRQQHKIEMARKLLMRWKSFGSPVQWTIDDSSTPRTQGQSPAPTSCASTHSCANAGTLPALWQTNISG